MTEQVRDRASEKIHKTDVFQSYTDEELPLKGYGFLTGAFAAELGGALLAAAGTRRLPDDVSFKDVLVMGVATHKASRLLGRDTVTSFLRAPFTRYQGPAHMNEINEQPRGKGLQRAVGELPSAPRALGRGSPEPSPPPSCTRHS